MTFCKLRKKWIKLKKNIHTNEMYYNNYYVFFFEKPLACKNRKLNDLRFVIS